MTIKKTTIAVVGVLIVAGGLMSLPYFSKPDAIADEVIKPVENISIVPILSEAVNKGEKFELANSSEFTIVSGQGAKIQEVRIFKSLDEKFDVGITKIDKATLNFHDWPIDEFVHLIEGRVEITDKDSNTKTYGPGESIVIPKGFNGVWKQLEPVTMIAIFYATEANAH